MVMEIKTNTCHYLQAPDKYNISYIHKIHDEYLYASKQ